MSEGIEETAKRLVRGDRQSEYGAPVVDFTRTGKVWAALLGLDTAISPEMVAILMAALKLSRLAETPRHKDSRIDTIGYMLTLDWVIEDLEKPAAELPDSPDVFPHGYVEDGFGSMWDRCSPACDMQVVRPGDARCTCAERQAA